MDDPVKKKARQKRYADKNAGAINAKSRDWYAANPMRAKATRADWRRRNAEKDRADVAAYQAANKAYLYRMAQERIAENRGTVNAWFAKRRATVRRAVPVWADLMAIDQIYAAAHAAQELFEIPVHVDHTVPLISKLVCGLHCEANLRLLPGRENQAKSNRSWPDMWGRLGSSNVTYTYLRE